MHLQKGLYACHGFILIFFENFPPHRRRDGWNLNLNHCFYPEWFHIFENLGHCRVLEKREPRLHPAVSTQHRAHQPSDREPPREKERPVEEIHFPGLGSRVTREYFDKILLSRDHRTSIDPIILLLVLYSDLRLFLHPSPSFFLSFFLPYPSAFFSNPNQARPFLMEFAGE